MEKQRKSVCKYKPIMVTKPKNESCNQASPNSALQGSLQWFPLTPALQPLVATLVQVTGPKKANYTNILIKALTKVF